MHPLNKKVKFMKDSIDFGSMEIPKLFRKLLIPTVLGMVFSAVFVITDGIFVGQGIGSDALAAVNITAPLFLISTGIGLMFGVGASVVASIHLSQGKLKTARINVTQAVVVSSLFLAVLWGVVCLFAPQVAVWLGSSERLLPLAVEYMYWFLPFLVFSALLSSGMFFVRLDGSPNYAMLCNAIPAVVNILLDYVFIFILKWGMMGAALATSLGYILGAGMIVVYLSRRRNVIHFCRVKLSKKEYAAHLAQCEIYVPLRSFHLFVRGSHSLYDVCRQLCVHPLFRRRWSGCFQYCLLFLSHYIYGI